MLGTAGWIIYESILRIFVHSVPVETSPWTFVVMMAWLEKADAVAALVVALMIMRMSGGLAFQAVNVMLDRAPSGLADRMTRAVVAVPGVVRATPVRLRESGNQLFADVVVTAARTASLAEAHDLTERIESAVGAVEPRTGDAGARGADLHGNGDGGRADPRGPSYRVRGSTAWLGAILFSL